MRKNLSVESEVAEIFAISQRICLSSLLSHVRMALANLSRRTPEAGWVTKGNERIRSRPRECVGLGFIVTSFAPPWRTAPWGQVV